MVFYTSLAGANPRYENDVFYRTQIGPDSDRVTRLFATARDVGIEVRQGQLGWQGLRDALQLGHRLAIVLVDKCKLRGISRCCCGLVNAGYVGHFLVVSAFRESSQEFVAHDPSGSPSSRLISVSALDQAWHAYGTDDDVLLVSRRVESNV